MCVCVCVCVCVVLIIMYLFMYECMYVCIYLCVCAICTYVFTIIYVCMYVFVTVFDIELIQVLLNVLLPVHAGIRGVTEQTTSGLYALQVMLKKRDLKVPSIVINNSVTKVTHKHVHAAVLLIVCQNISIFQGFLPLTMLIHHLQYSYSVVFPHLQPGIIFLFPCSRLFS